MQARRLPARHGMLWLLASFRLFRSNPPLITALTMAYMFVVVTINLLPLVGPFLLPIALPTLIAILANGCRAVQRGGGVGVIALTFGLRKRRIELVRLGGLHLLGSISLLLASALIEGGPTPLGGPGVTLTQGEVLAILLRLMLIAIPIVAAFWFAPLLTTWDEIAPTKSIFFSFIACWRNWRAFAVYGLLVGGLATLIPGIIVGVDGLLGEAAANVIGFVLKMAMLFFLAPILMCSVFISYQDVFHGAPQNPQA